MKVSVIGGGSWGLGLSKVLSDNHHQVLVYDVDDKIVEKINTLHVCIQLNEFIPEDIRATNNLQEAVEYSDILLFVVPTKVLRQAIHSIKPWIRQPKLIINAAKGIEPESFLRVSEIFEECLTAQEMKGFVALSGPSHAEEVIRGLVTSVTAASDQEIYAKEVQKLFHNAHYFRVYSSTDTMGIELGGALKNIFALAAGVIRGQGLGDNASAALMTRGLVEMAKIYDALGASKESLMGLSGVGDLIVTCSSEHSRNFQAGLKIGRGKDLNETLDSMTMVVEGIRTCEAAYYLSRDKNLDTPIIDALFDVLFNRVEPKKALEILLSRALKAE